MTFTVDYQHRRCLSRR